MIDTPAEISRMAALYRITDAEPRLPPQAVQAEQSVLGGLLLDPSAWPKVADMLAEGDFYHARHQLIFRAIRALAEHGKPHDAVTVGDFLVSRGHGEQVGNGADVVALTGCVPSAANIAAYSDLVAGKARLRRAIEAGTALVDACFSPGDRDADEVISDAARELSELQPKAQGGARDMRETLTEWLTQYERLCQSHSGITGLPTQWGMFNTITHGLQPATVYVIAARPSMGKSAFALNLALHSGQRGTETVLFSLEMSAADCQTRNIASLGDIPHDWLLAPGASDDNGDGYAARIPELIRQMKSATVRIDDTPSITSRQFEARTLRLHQKKKIELLIVDHMHDFKIDPKLARYEYGEIVQAAKRLAKQLHIPVVLMAQLNRQLSGRADKRPTLTDLRESGEIEQKADVIAFLHREDYYDTPDHKTHLQGVVELHIAKGRNIKSGERIYFKNRLDVMRLDDWDGPLPQAAEDSSVKSYGFGGGYKSKSKSNSIGYSSGY